MTTRVILHAEERSQQEKEVRPTPQSNMLHFALLRLAAHASKHKLDRQNMYLSQDSDQ